MPQTPAHAPTGSLVLPVHNQADHIGPMVGRYLTALERVSFEIEILLVENGSRDDSRRVCHELAERHPAVRVIELAAGGWGRAVKAGLSEARGEYLCYTNSARTTAEMVTLVFAYATAYPDVVLKASRRTRDSRRRRLGSVLYNLQCRALFDLSCWDVNGTPKVFPRRFGALLELQRDDDLIDVEFAWTCRREAYPLVEVPILVTERHGGRSTTSYGSAARMYWGAWQMHREGRGRDGATADR